MIERRPAPRMRPAFPAGAGRTALGLALALLLVRPAAVRAGDGYVVPNGLRGMSGLINTPTADVLPSGTLRFGFSLVDKQWAYHARGFSDNNHYFLSVGFLPRVEVSILASYFPHDKLSKFLEGEGTVDRGGSGRLLLLDEGRTRPAVAVGIDDARGTRRFHALYIVGSKWVRKENLPVEARLSAGYGSTALRAKNHILDGVFGGGEFVVRDAVSLALDYDTEKWNTSIRLIAFHRLAAYFAFLNFEAPAGGFSWTQPF